MEKLGLDDMELVEMMATEGKKIIDEVKEDLEANPEVSKSLIAAYYEGKPMLVLPMSLLLIYATMNPDVRRRLDTVADMYREASA